MHYNACLVGNYPEQVEGCFKTGGWMSTPIHTGLVLML